MLIATLLLLAAAVALPSPASAAAVPPGFDHVVIASGISNPVAMTVAPDGRIFLTEKGGWTNSGSPLQARVRVIKNDALLSTAFATLPNVYGGGERGLLGITLDPAFASNHYVYVFYTALLGDGTYRNRVSRLIADGDVARAVNGVLTETVLFDLPDLASNQSHQSGGLHFGLDGKLYVTTGDNMEPDQSQSLASIKGKVLRLNPDGTIPADNPFVGKGAAGKYQAIWALGLRNPFTFAVQPGTGRMFVNDVGEAALEEINDGIAGSNYGWPLTEGPTSDPRFRGPVYSYGHEPSTSSPVSGCAITGGAFYDPATANFPAEYVGNYIFADFCGGYLKRYDLASGTVTDFATTEQSPVDVQVGPDGSLFYLTYSGSVVRIRYTRSDAPSVSQQPAPQIASVGEAATFIVSATGSAPLSYQWQRDGVDLPGATSASYTLSTTTLADDGAMFSALVGNNAGAVTSTAARLTVTANVRPTVVITAPVAGAVYAGGQTISFAGTGSDAEDGVLPPSAFTWRVDFHHDDHTHPFIDDVVGIRSGTFTVPRVGETESNVWYRVHLSIHDSGGLVRSTFRDVVPRKTMLALATSPAGLPLDLDGQPRATPFSTSSVVGVTRTLGAPATQLVNGNTHAFVSWSDGGARTHTVNTPSVATTYTATYRKIVAPDLVVTGVSWSPTGPVAGDAVRFRATVKNQGTTPTPAGVVHRVGFKVDGVTASWSDTATGSLAPGASVTLSANGGGQSGLWTATAGAHTVLAHVDDINWIPGEVNETNNTLSVPLTIAGSTPVPTVITLTPTADAFGSSGAPTTNYGTNASLLSRGTPGAASYLRFALPAAPAGQSLTGAVLKLRTTTDTTSGSADSHPVRIAGDGWTEAALTWNNKPAITGALLGTISGATAVNTAFNTVLTPSALTGLLGTQQTFGITSPGSNSLYAWSRNFGTASSRPQLVLTFETQTTDSIPPSQPTNLAAAVNGPTVTLAWTDSTDDIGVVGYDVHRSSVADFTPTAITKVAAPMATSYAETPGVGTWYYLVIARDAAGNASPLSDQASATVTATSTPTVLTVSPTADAFGNSGAATTNYGTNSSLLSRGTLGAASYLRFTLPSAPAGKTLTGAVLRLRTTTDTTSGSADSHPVRVAGDGWTEAGLTWNNKPAITGALLGTITGARTVNASFDTALTPSAVAALLSSTQTFGITSTGGDSLYMWSQNYGTTTSRPQLTLTFM